MQGAPAVASSPLITPAEPKRSRTYTAKAPATRLSQLLDADSATGDVDAASEPPSLMELVKAIVFMRSAEDISLMKAIEVGIALARER
jgi:hypothetical protein